MTASMVKAPCGKEIHMKFLTKIGMAFLLTACFLLGTSLAADEKATVNVGDPAPTFEAMDDQGNEWKSAEHVGKSIVVVYFYPADLTGGCTKQACCFRDDSKKLEDKGVTVVGVSGDSVKNHQLFKKVKQLNFTLLADPDGAVAKKFGVPLSKGGDFKFKDEDGTETVLTRGVTAKRWTFVIGKDGKIIYKNTMVDPTKDSQQILAAIEKQER
jgi:peroxiredoxin Q/BCP